MLVFGGGCGAIVSQSGCNDCRRQGLNLWRIGFVLGSYPPLLPVSTPDERQAVALKPRQFVNRPSAQVEMQGRGGSLLGCPKIPYKQQIASY